MIILPFVAGAQLNLDLLGHLPYDSSTLAGCWHHVDDFGHEYGLIGTSQGLSVVNLDDPTHPKQRFLVPGPVNNWREVRTSNGYAYVSTEAPDAGITIVDLHNLPDSIRWKTWKGNGAFEGLIGASHSVAAEDGYLYIFGSSGLASGVIICSLADPWNPQITGWYNGAYFHDGFVRGDTLWGSEITNGRFSVLDISDKTAPQFLAAQTTPGAFNHNTWLSTDGNTLFTTDEVGSAPLAAFHVQQLDNIELLDTYWPSQNPAKEVHNVRGFGNFLVNPSYGGQLTIVDATYPDNLIETAWTLAGKSLVWDANPYLPSGILFATSKTGGLFVFQPQYQQAAYLHGAVSDLSTGLPLAGVQVQISANPQISDLSKADGNYKTGVAQAGNHTVTFEKTGYESLSVSGVQLQNGQISVLNVDLIPLPLTTVKSAFQRETVKVYPTLVQDQFTVEIPEGSPLTEKGATISLFNLQGLVILETEVAGPRTLISLPGGLAPGTYVVSVKNQRAFSRPVRIVKE